MSAVFKATLLAADLLLPPAGCASCFELGEQCQDCEYETRKSAEVECPYGDEVCEHKRYDAEMCEQCAEDCGYTNQMEIEV